jgi:hypothetical protein
MTTVAQTKLLQQETIEQLDGTKTVLSYFAPTEETMQELVADLFRATGSASSLACACRALSLRCALRQSQN